MKTTPNVKGRSGASTGITEDLAAKLYAKKGTRLLAIVEFQSDKTHEGLDGNRQVDLTIETIEPVVDGNLNGELDEHVRTIQAALFRNRKLAEGADDELPLGEEDGPTPKVADIIQQGQPFVVDEDELAAREAEDAAAEPDGDTPDDTPDDEPDDDKLAAGAPAAAFSGAAGVPG